MTDARHPEAWLNDRRVVRLSDAAHRLFVTANAWAASNRTDGSLEVADLALIHGVDARHHTELVSAGLWTSVPGGWQVVDFHKTQTTKAQLDGLDHKRHLDRERKARAKSAVDGLGLAGPALGGHVPREGYPSQDGGARQTAARGRGWDLLLRGDDPRTV